VEPTHAQVLRRPLREPRRLLPLHDHDGARKQRSPERVASGPDHRGRRHESCC
jgi:hypothetical protein